MLTPVDRYVLQTLATRAGFEQPQPVTSCFLLANGHRSYQPMLNLGPLGARQHRIRCKVSRLFSSPRALV